MAAYLEESWTEANDDGSKVHYETVQKADGTGSSTIETKFDASGMPTGVTSYDNSTATEQAPVPVADTATADQSQTSVASD